MSARKWIPVVLLAALTSLSVGCGGGSTFNVQNPPPPPQQAVSVTLQSVPAAPSAGAAIPIAINANVALTASVANDPENDGVDWRLSCTAQKDCGTLLPAHTASGQAATYTPPAAFLGNTLGVDIVAYSTYNQTKNVLQPVNITAFGNVLSGTYIFQAVGSDPTPEPYQIAGAIVLDGNGNVVSGQQTQNTVALGSQTTSIVSAGSSYFVGSDGRGTLVLNTNINGAPVTETFSLVVLSSSKVLIAELDSNSGNGTLELQDPNAASTLPSGGFAFVTSGTDFTGANPIVYGAVISIDSSGNIPGTGSVADYTAPSAQFGGYLIEPCGPPNGPGGTVSWSNNASPSTVVLINFTSGDCLAPLSFLGYIVDATHVQLIENDDPSATSGFLTAGPALGQGTSAGTFTNASFSGSWVFDILGISTPADGVIPSSLTVGGLFCPDGVGGLDSCEDANGNPSGGYMDALLLVDNNGLPYAISAGLTTAGGYFVDIHSLGRTQITNIHLKPQPFPTEPLGPNAVVYLTGSNTLALVLFTGGPGKNYPAIGVGTAYPQATNPESIPFNGQYGFSFMQQNGSENDGTSQMTATPNAAAPGGTLAGLTDDFANAFGSTPLALVGSYGCPSGAAGCPDSYGRFSNSLFNPAGTNNAVAFYMIDPTQGYVVETDTVNSSQVSLGYFANRCNVANAASCQSGAAAAATARAMVRRKRH